MELQFHDVAKRYGAKEALRGIDLTLTPGNIYQMNARFDVGVSTLESGGGDPADAVVAGNAGDERLGCAEHQSTGEPTDGGCGCAVDVPHEQSRGDAGEREPDEGAEPSAPSCECGTGCLLHEVLHRVSGGLARPTSRTLRPVADGLQTADGRGRAGAPAPRVSEMQVRRPLLVVPC